MCSLCAVSIGCCSTCVVCFYFFIFMFCLCCAVNMCHVSFDVIPEELPISRRSTKGRKMPSKSGKEWKLLNWELTCVGTVMNCRTLVGFWPDVCSGIHCLYSMYSKSWCTTCCTCCDNVVILGVSTSSKRKWTEEVKAVEDKRLSPSTSTSTGNVMVLGWTCLFHNWNCIKSPILFLSRWLKQLQHWTHYIFIFLV